MRRLQLLSLLLSAIIVSAFLSAGTFAQTKKQSVNPWNKKVRVSPKAFLTQTIGITDVTISYSRPGVKKRKIWGGLVPYNKVWRAGANEATKFTFSKNVMVEGKKFPAGAYSFFVIPTPQKWTVIFNKVSDQWGAFEYNEAEDFYRFKVTPEKAPYHEWLEYAFSGMKVDTSGGYSSATVNLIWDNLKVPFKIEAPGK